MGWTGRPIDKKWGWCMVEWNILITFARMKVVHAILSKRIVLALLVVLGLCLTVRGHSVDSLYVKYQNSDNNKLKIALANDIFSELYDSHFVDTLYSYDSHSKPAVVETNLHYWMAEYYFDKERYAQSLAAISIADTLSRGLHDKQLRSEVLMTMYNAHYRLANYDKALKSLLEAYRIDLELGDEGNISSDLNSLAAIYLAVRQPKPGIKFIEQAIALERKLKRSDRLAMRLGIASELYLMNNEPGKALETIEEAYQIDNQAGRAEKAAVRLTQKGAVLENMSKHNEALAVLLKAIPVLEKAENAYSMAVCYNQLASVNEKLGNRETAIGYYKKALEQSIKCGSPRTERVAERGLWQTMHEDNPTIAALHLERYTSLTDSLQTKLMSALAGVMDVTAQNLTAEELSEGQNRISQVMKWGIILFTLMLLLILGGITFAWRKTRSAMKIHRQAQETKSHFFTNITSELQTPLTVIMNAGQQLVEGGKTNAEDRKKLGEMIINHGNNMLVMVNQLLEIEKVKSVVEKPDMRTGDIVMFVRMLVDNYTEEASNKLIQLEFRSPLSSLIVEFPIDYIRKIVQTLVSFAIKFTPRNGNVTVMLDQYETGRLRIVVSDTGKGVPQEEIDRIFDPLSQGYENNDNGAQVSIGLTLVNQIVQAMNGNIAVDSGPNQGTKFTITFPVQVIKNNAGDEAADTITQFAEKRLRPDSKQLPLVFIVENNEDVAFFIASRLRERYHLRLARDGREALQNAQDLVPDLIITNMTMPVMDGWELIKRLRSTPTLKHIPIIAMTSNMSEQERMACIETGADNVLVKPFNSGELRLVAEHLINQRSVIRDRLIQSRNDSSRDVQSSPLSKEDQDFVSKLVDVIHAQMAKDDIDMEHIAAALSLSRKQLRTRVMTITGLTPVAYVLQVRLNYARRMIANEDESLTTIASKCGFQNLSHFSKAFKQQFGVSPMQFRKNLGDMSVGHVQT